LVEQYIDGQNLAQALKSTGPFSQEKTQELLRSFELAISLLKEHGYSPVEHISAGRSLCLVFAPIYMLA
jgi:hypothetical protein